MIAIVITFPLYNYKKHMSPHCDNISIYKHLWNKREY